MFSPNTSEERKQELKNILAIQHKEEFGTYLGAPATFSASKIAGFKILCDRVNARISTWGASTLTQAGKLILISGILSTLCSHVMSVFLIPKSITNKLDSMIKRFFWKFKGKERGIHWKNKHLLETPKGMGGLGIRNTSMFNKALLFKYAWRCAAARHTRTASCHNCTNTSTICSQWKQQ